MRIQARKEIFKLWCWAITNSQFSMCKITFIFPIYFAIDKGRELIEIGILPYWGLDVWIPWEVEDHYRNRDNPEFEPRLCSDDTPF